MSQECTVEQTSILVHHNQRSIVLGVAVNIALTPPSMDTRGTCLIENAGSESRANGSRINRDRAGCPVELLRSIATLREQRFNLKEPGRL